jgi:hypothetical protein
LANDNNFIYDAVSNFIVRITYSNNNFKRFDSLFIGTRARSVSISPDFSFLLAAIGSGVLLMSIQKTKFRIEAHGIISSPPTSFTSVSALLIMNNKRIFAFSNSDTNIYALDLIHLPRKKVFPVLNPAVVASSSSGVLGSPLQCTKNKQETFAVCVYSSSSTRSKTSLVKYDLEPFSVAIKQRIEEENSLTSCDLFEKKREGEDFTSDDDSSHRRVICAQSEVGAVFFSFSTLERMAISVSVPSTGTKPKVVVDSANEIALHELFQFLSRRSQNHQRRFFFSFACCNGFFVRRWRPERSFASSHSEK